MVSLSSQDLAGPHWGPQRLGHPAGARQKQGLGAKGPLGPPLAPHLLTGHQQSHKKSYKAFFLILAGPVIPARQGAQGKRVAGTPGMLNVHLPPKAYLKLLLTAVFRGT